MFGGVDLPKSRGRGFPPRIVVRGKLCAGMTGEVVGCSGEWTCLGVRAVGSRPGSFRGRLSAGMTGEVVGCSGEWSCAGVGAVGSRLRGNDERGNGFRRMALVAGVFWIPAFAGMTGEDEERVCW